MTHYNTAYVEGSREQKDEQAIKDMIDYIGTTPEKIILFAQLAVLANCIEYEIPCQANDGSLRKQTIQGLNMTFGFAGISGRPFHAFCRKFCVRKYREWLSSTSGGDPVVSDEQGYWAEGEINVA